VVIIGRVDSHAPVGRGPSRIGIRRIGVVDLDLSFDRKRASIRPGVAFDKNQEVVDPN
jgi:hypothetical protein